jgi:phosphogluconate dehydratase
MNEMNPVVDAVTKRIIERSRQGRNAYLDLIARARDAGVNRPTLSCGNLAHGFAASGDDKPVIRGGHAMNIGIITAYNDMLSAHQPDGRYPEQIKMFARERGATAQVAGGVPAMCDGVTQGQPSMELSLFSRDTIALGKRKDQLGFQRAFDVDVQLGLGHVLDQGAQGRHAGVGWGGHGCFLGGEVTPC